MAFPRLSASMLLASLILLLYWTAASARSHDRTSSNLSPLYRVKRDMPSNTKERVAASFTVLKDSLSVVKEVVGKSTTSTVSGVIKSLVNIASLAPGIAGLVSSFLNLALSFVPQQNPLKALKEGFAEVNRKLDSLSIRISNLATDVEWFNYASVYSQDEVRILNAWKKFGEFRENSELVQSEDDKLRLAEVFTNYYENTATEASVANLYHYLTVSNMSLSGNLNDLLRKKFKCSIREIGNYNLHFITLLWRGMVLNQLYWDLIGLSQTGITDRYTEMLKNVSSAQVSVVEFCLNNYEQYVTNDAEEISKALSPDDKEAIAEKVKKALDEKFYWYNWVVLVYKSDDDSYHRFYSKMINVSVNPITVSVGYTQKADEIHKAHVMHVLNQCTFYRMHPTGPFTAPNYPLCTRIIQKIKECNQLVAGVPIRDYVKEIESGTGDFVQVPEKLMQIHCKGSRFTDRMSVYYSRTIDPCVSDTCETGECKRLLDSNEHLCECPDGYYGDRCEKELNPNNVPAIDKSQTVPDFTSINAKLRAMEAKLDDILNKTCPAQ
ncbi:uncharacterized protein LOC125879420 [Epinephelus fuscoguttatus]|uniref:uncharacterized protein LOC125879420 n=1 Tax=Epinephelus fuscoguttatus TaxID=293821 RepID=UPI0020D0DCFB|nr:uncharacterized protein LOC125879420 [Epinephelus fuscoguttatus]